MRRDEVLAILAAHRDEIWSRGVKSLSLFGSMARDEDDPGSEIDILVEIGQRPFGMLAFVGLQLYLEEILGRPVHLVTPNGIQESDLRDRILKEAVRAA
jgi:predicted nucleotidyltransferase